MMPTSIVLENVGGLLRPPRGTNPFDGKAWHSNLDYCELLMREAGYVMITFLLDPRLFGQPVRRSTPPRAACLRTRPWPRPIRSSEGRTKPPMLFNA